MGIDPVLLQRYRETEYRVHDGPRRFTLVLDRPSRDLAALYRERGVATAAFMTAFNPYSQPTPDEENRAANARLRDELRALGLDGLDATGSDAAGSWQEASFLIPGIPREQAEALGRAYRQNAIVFAGADAVPRLVLLA